MALKWKTVAGRSSNVYSFAYDKAANNLFIEFLNGAIYKYSNVPSSIYYRFLNSSSFGKFVWRAIRGKFTYEKVGEPSYKVAKMNQNKRMKKYQRWLKTKKRINSLWKKSK